MQGNFTLVDIYWQEPLYVQFNHTTKQYSLRDLPELDDEGGVYQIYGHHPVYGRHVLLYIGKAFNFSGRFGQHLDSRFWDHVNLKCSVGTVYIGNKTVGRNDSELLSAIEALLIQAHAPALNTMSKNQVPKLSHALLVCNRDWREQLAPEVSGYLCLGREQWIAQSGASAVSLTPLSTSSR